MQKIGKVIVVGLLGLCLSACDSSQEKNSMSTTSSEKIELSNDLKQKVASAFSLDVDKITDNGTTQLSTGDLKVIYTYDGTMFGNIERDNQIFSMYAGNRIRNDLQEKAEQLGIESIQYPVSEFHSDIEKGYAGARLVVLLKEDTEENRQEVLHDLKGTYQTDLTKSISFSDDIPNEFLDSQEAIWVE